MQEKKKKFNKNKPQGILGVIRDGQREKNLLHRLMSTKMRKNITWVYKALTKLGQSEYTNH